MDDLAGFIRPPEGFEHEFVVTNPVVRRDGRLWVGRLTGWDPESAELLPEGLIESVVSLESPVRLINEGQVIGLLGSRLAGPVLSVLEGSGRLRAMLGGWPVASNGSRWSLLSPQEFLEASTLVAERARAQVLEALARSGHVDSTDPAARIYATFEGVPEEDRIVLLALLSRMSGDDRQHSLLRLEYKMRVGPLGRILKPLSVRMRRLHREAERSARHARSYSSGWEISLHEETVQRPSIRVGSSNIREPESWKPLADISFASLAFDIDKIAQVPRRRDLRKLGDAAEEPNVRRN